MNTVYLVANGDLRLAANQMCEPAQAAMEKALVAAIQKEEFFVKRAHPFDEKKGHGFIDSQRAGIQIFHSIPKGTPVVVAESVWQYSQHILPGLLAHEGPILTVANWSGTWPGLVGLLNLNGCLKKAGVKYNSLWSEDFKDKFFVKKLRQWLTSDKINHNTSHVQKLKEVKVPGNPRRLGEKFAGKFRQHQVILGVFDEGCMGMYNGIIPDELLSPLGVFKERLSQSTLYARMLATSDQEARQILDWLKNRGMKFCFGSNEETDLTENQVLQQCKMYLAGCPISGCWGHLEANTDNGPSSLACYCRIEPFLHQAAPLRGAGPATSSHSLRSLCAASHPRATGGAQRLAPPHIGGSGGGGSSGIGGGCGSPNAASAADMAP